ncbi:MAG: endo-1,4-beta-xylanase [Planctomycetota bacterium]
MGAYALAPVPGNAVVLSDFSSGGFDYFFDDFSESYNATDGTVRLSDSINGWGGAGISFSSPVDFSGLLDQYVQADFRVEPNHATNQFVIELYDTSDRSIKFNAQTGGPAGPDYNRWISNTSLGSPVDGIGDFQNFDYTQVRNWQVLGQFGNTQSFDVSFDQVSITPEAPELYAGAAADAPWRAEADVRIDQHRKADLQINVKLADGRAAPGAQVNVAQQEHAFGFGTAVATRLLAGSQANSFYQSKLRQHFNLAVTENSLKWPAWEGDFGPNFSPAITIAALNWLEANDIDARGHVMVWPSFANSPNNIAGLQNNPAALRQAVLDHIAEIGAVVGDRVFEWDVLNEPRSNNDFMQILGYEEMAEWFKAADQATDARLFLNEFGLVTGGDSTAGNRAEHHGYIQSILANGGPLEGLGIQSHFRPDDLTGIEQVWDIFDEFGVYGLPIAITEFDFETTDRELQAAYAADFLTAAFAHESVSEFLNWGFWAGAHWRPEAALFDESWNLRPHGEAMFDLIYNEWWTEELLDADQLGEAALRGFKGEYEVTVTLGQMTRVVTVTLDDDGEIVDVVLPGGQMGDMDFNGVLDDNDALAFVMALTSPLLYDTAYGLDPRLTGDVNQDGLLNLADVELFAALLPDSGSSALAQLVTVPEPSGLWLAGGACLIFARRRMAPASP